MVPPRPRPSFDFTPEERAQQAHPAPHQKAAVLLLLARNLEQQLRDPRWGYQVQLEMRDNGGITLTVDPPTPGPDQLELP